MGDFVIQALGAIGATAAGLAVVAGILAGYAIWRRRRRPVVAGPQQWRDVVEAQTNLAGELTRLRLDGARPDDLLTVDRLQLEPGDRDGLTAGGLSFSAWESTLTFREGAKALKAYLKAREHAVGWDRTADTRAGIREARWIGRLWRWPWYGMTRGWRLRSVRASRRIDRCLARAQRHLVEISYQVPRNLSPDLPWPEEAPEPERGRAGDRRADGASLEAVRMRLGLARDHRDARDVAQAFDVYEAIIADLLVALEQR